jgi:tetratricopeptide (TPR) repeat protein
MSGQAPAHAWAFRPRFRRRAFGWRGSLQAVKRVREAVSEIRQVARKDPLLGGEGAVLLLEKLSPALEQVDSSSGALGNAVHRAIEALVPVIAVAPAEPDRRIRWLDRLWQALEADKMPWIESLGDHWGELCAGPALASHWANALLDDCRAAWRLARREFVFFQGTTVCLSALLAAERHDELLALLDEAPSHAGWHYRRYGVAALAALGRKAEAIRYAEASRGLNDSPVAIAATCEGLLISSGLADEAYARYGLEANRANTYLAWFRAVARKYPHKDKTQILADLVASTPGEEGKWFAAAKSAGLYAEAIALANATPCAPQTLTRAARDFEEKQPAFALEAGMAALRWLCAGYGYEVTRNDVLRPTRTRWRQPSGWGW